LQKYIKLDLLQARTLAFSPT